MPFITEQIEHRCSRLYTENHKTLLRETKGNLNKWMNIPYFTVNIVKMFIYRSNAILTKIRVNFFLVEMYKLILNFIWQCKGLRRVKMILKKKKEMIVAVTLLISRLTIKIQQ